MKNEASEVEIRAIREMGKLLKQKQEAGEIAKKGETKITRDVPNKNISKQTLPEIGITRKESSTSKATFYRWTETQRENAKKEQARKTLELYLKCWTQEQIADELKISQKNVSDVLENFSKNCTNAKNTKIFEPFIYNIWNTQKGNETSHFGSFPEVFMENLL